MSTLTVPQWALAKAMQGFWYAQVGYYPPGLIEEWLSSMGTVPYLRFFWQYTRVFGRLTKEYGDADAQFLAGLAATWNGCGFCGYGHTLTGALLYFREHDAVHPLTTRRIEGLMESTDDEAIARLEAILADEPHRSLWIRAQRMYALKVGQRSPRDGEDELLLATAWLWTWMVDCTIVQGLTAQPETAVPHSHPVYRDKDLRERYERRRTQVEPATRR